MARETGPPIVTQPVAKPGSEIILLIVGAGSHILVTPTRGEAFAGATTVASPSDARWYAARLVEAAEAAERYAARYAAEGNGP